MPEHCAAYSCSNRRTAANKARGITFHKFPKDKAVRKTWEKAVRRRAFTASCTTVLCSEHFEQEDFDRTGQIVRLREGVIPSVFNFPGHPPRVVSKVNKPRLTATSRKAEEGLPVAPPKDPPKPAPPKPAPPTPHPKLTTRSVDDHGYALPASLTALKARLNKALARVECLEKEKKNAMAREKRAKNTLD